MGVTVGPARLALSSHACQGAYLCSMAILVGVHDLSSLGAPQPRRAILTSREQERPRRVEQYTTDAPGATLDLLDRLVGVSIIDLDEAILAAGGDGRQ